MNDSDLKKLTGLIKDLLKPVQGEIARITTELRGFKMNIYKLDTEVRKNGQESARIASEVENTRDWLGEELGDINLKLDKLSEEKKETKKEISVIKKHIGLATEP